MSSENDDVAGEIEDIWSGDLLGRKEFADFLTRTLVTRTQTIADKQSDRGWAVSLDAPWGAGKSFFVERWVKALRCEAYPVVFFDAWENDLGADASIALMAEINEELGQWIKRLPQNDAFRNRARELTTRATRKLRRALMPVAKALASGLLRKAIGAGIEELLDASKSRSPDAEVQEIKSAAEVVLDKAFETSLDEHQRRKQHVREFKIALAEVIDLIHDKANAEIPMFVFVDELDRCRPTYAITLLEEMKHIFGMRKVCFIVSTNLSQLKHSIGAVYGASFDSETYLKRFFDQSIGLPWVSPEQHIDTLFSYFTGLSGKNHLSGLPEPASEASSKKAIMMVFNAFHADPRSQKQIFRIAECVAASLYYQPVHILYLFFLSALSHTSQSLFDELDARKITVIDIFEKIKIKNIKISYEFYSARKKMMTVANESLVSLLNEYNILSHSKHQEINLISSRQHEQYEYIINRLRHEQSLGSDEFPSLSKYCKLVKYAGYFDATEIE